MIGSIASGVVGQLVLVVSGVLVARALGPENRGILALVFVLSAIAVQLGSLGVPVAVTYWIAAQRMNARSLIQGLRGFRNLQVVVILAVQAGLILVVLEPKSPPGFVWVGFLSLAATAAGLSEMYGLAVLQGQRRFGAFNLLRLLYVLLYAVGVIWLWRMNQATLTSITLVIIAASIIAAGVIWVIVLHGLPAPDENTEVRTRPIVWFGLRSLFGSSPPLETFRLDQLLVGLALPPIVLGYYIVALAFTNLTRFVGQSIGIVTYPKVAAAGERSSQLQIIRHDFALGAAVCGTLTLALILAVPRLLTLFFGSDFEPAGTAAKILLVGTFFSAIRRILVDGTRGSGWPMWGATAELVTLLALPAVVLVTQFTDSLAAVAVVITAANLAGLLTIAPALWGFGPRFHGEQAQEFPSLDTHELPSYDAANLQPAPLSPVQYDRAASHRESSRRSP